MQKRVKVNNPVYRLFRWVEDKLPTHMDLGWWAISIASIITAALGTFLLLGGIHQWEVIRDPKMGMTLRVLSAVSNPFAFLFALGMYYIALMPYAYTALARMMRRQLRICFSNEIAEATKDFGYCQYQGQIDERLSALATAYTALASDPKPNRGDVLHARARFWRAHNVAWAWGFEVLASVKDYTKEGRN